MKSPFKFLESFDINDEDIFFGFDQEIEALYELVHQTNLILVYGYSGTGKTSLIQCGLANRFHGPQWFPFIIRRGEDINASLRSELQETLHRPVDNKIPLPTLVKKVYHEYLSPMYLMFDQFEELFILGSQDEQKQFVEGIQELLKLGSICKIILIIREEFLGAMYRLEKDLPTLFDFKFRVETMNYQRIEQVLHASFNAFNISLEPPAENRIREMIGNLGDEEPEIQLSYLQVYLDMLWKEDFARTYPEGVDPGVQYPPVTFTQQEIANFGKIDGVLKRYLVAQERRILEELYHLHPGIKLAKDTVHTVLDRFVTKEGTKQPIYFEREGTLLQLRLSEELPLAPAVVKDCLELLEQNRILRFRDDSLELAHDSLAKLIDDERTAERKRHNDIKVELETLSRTGHALNAKFLNEYAADLSVMTLDPELAEFVQDSKERLIRQQEEQERQLKEQQRQREEQRRQREEQQQRLREEQQRQRDLEKDLAYEREAGRRKRNFSIVIAILVVITLTATAYAYSERLKVDNLVTFKVGIKSAEDYTTRGLHYDQALRQLDNLIARIPESSIPKAEWRRVNSLRASWQTLDDTVSRADSLLRLRSSTEDIEEWPGAFLSYKWAQSLDSDNAWLAERIGDLEHQLKEQAKVYYERSYERCSDNVERSDYYFDQANELLSVIFDPQSRPDLLE